MDKPAVVTFNRAEAERLANAIDTLYRVEPRERYRAAAMMRGAVAEIDKLRNRVERLERRLEKRI